MSSWRNTVRLVMSVNLEAAAGEKTTRWPLTSEDPSAVASATDTAAIEAPS
jgi:hypothetical protein